MMSLSKSIPGIATAILTLVAGVLMGACADDRVGADLPLTRKQVVEIVRTELPDTSAPTQQAVSRTDVEELIEAAVASIPAPEPGISRAEAEQIAEAAVANLEIPAPEPGLVSTDVERMIQEAISADRMSSPDVSRANLEEIARYQLAKLPPKSNAAEYTKFFVESAISRYEAEGLDATLRYYNSERSVDGQWYVFIIDTDDIVIGHYNAYLIGENLKGSLGTDANGYEFGPDMLSATEDGKWV